VYKIVLIVLAIVIVAYAVINDPVNNNEAKLPIILSILFF